MATEREQLTQKQIMREAAALLDRVMPMFVGKHPAVIGVVLAELTDKWISGHSPPEVRRELLDAHFAYIRQLLDLVQETLQ